MVIFCKHCGSPVKLENARLADLTYKVKCQQCRRAVALEPLRPPPGTARPTASDSPSAAPGPGAAAAAPPAMDPAAPPSERSHYLQKIRLFRDLPYEECLLLESHLRPREFAPQQTIVQEGGPGDAMFFITAGAVEVRKKDPDTGIDFLLSELKAGACFGEMALLTGRPRAASVVAVGPTSCSVLEQPAFDEVLLTSPKVSLAMSRVLAERLEEADQQTGIEHLSLSRLQFDPRVLKLLPQPMILEHRVLPVAFQNNRLTLAMVNPANPVALDEVRRVIKGVIIEPVVTSEDDFLRFMGASYAELLRKAAEKQARERTVTVLRGPGGDKSTAGEASAAQSDSLESVLASLENEALESLPPGEGGPWRESVTDLSLSATDAPIIRVANSLLALAIKRGASDIHLEPQEKELAVRFRIDGALQPVEVLPKKIQVGLTTRFKILSQLDPAERRLPQEGRISVRLEERSIDFRVSTLPSKWGEKICLRILDTPHTLLGLEKLILHPEVLRLVREMLALPSGTVYVIGPSGSGKTHPALQRSGRAEPPRREHFHRRRPHRMRSATCEPGQDPRGNRPGLCQHPARLPVPGPRHYPGGRDARQRNRTPCRGGRPGRSPGVHHARRKQHGRRLHPSGRDGYRAVFALELDPRHHRAATHPPPLSKMQGTLCRRRWFAETPGPRPGETPHLLSRQGLRAVLAQRLSWTRGRVRSPAHERRPAPLGGRRREPPSDFGRRCQARHEDAGGLLPVVAAEWLDHFERSSESCLRA